MLFYKRIIAIISHRSSVKARVRRTLLGKKVVFGLFFYRNNCRDPVNPPKLSERARNEKGEMVKTCQNSIDARLTQPAEARHRNKVEIITTLSHQAKHELSWSVRRVESVKFSLLGIEDINHQPRWRFCGFFEKLRRGRLL